ncbi:MAG: hypothetical protein V4437_00345, partial [Patescibacteria group bacterium]
MSVEITPQNRDPDVEEVLRYRSIWLATPGRALTRKSAFEAFFGRLMQLEARGKMEEFLTRAGYASTRTLRTKSVRTSAERSETSKAM